MENFALNEWALNSWSNQFDTSLLYLSDGISIGWFQLCGPNAWITVQYNDRSYDNKFYDNQYIDWQRLISHLIKEKRLSIKFVLKASSNDELQTVVDDFKNATSWQKTNGVVLFTVSVSWETRVLKVVVQDTEFNEDGIVSNVQTGTLTVVAVDPPRFYSYLVNTKYYQNISANFTGQINNYWNAITYPVYYFVFNSASWVTQMKRSVSGYEIIINTPIVTWDIIVISSDIYSIIKQADVYKNDISIDYTGQITTPLQSGSNNVSFTCNWTYSVDITVLYNKMRE